MGKIAIEFQNISKQYALGSIGTGTLSRDLNRWWARIRGKEDPYLRIGEENDRSKKATGDFVWALKDINFHVEEGEVLGIIGKNGAGKSTLLKILSRVTSPTAGCIRARGRIASLLEVGTGFHPEMTGRENIYMNGSIMGMTKAEITRKLDEIVAFAGVEKYIDTPVKRYSSGIDRAVGICYRRPSGAGNSGGGRGVGSGRCGIPKEGYWQDAGCVERRGTDSFVCQS